MIFGTLSFRGCWGQSLALVWNIRVKSQMPITTEHAFKEKSTKSLILLPLRTLYNRTFQCETPCIFIGCYETFPEILNVFWNKLPICIVQSIDWMSCVSMGCSKTFPELLKMFRNKFLIFDKTFSPGNTYCLAETGFASCMYDILLELSNFPPFLNKREIKTILEHSVQIHRIQQPILKLPIWI